MNYKKPFIILISLIVLIISGCNTKPGSNKTEEIKNNQLTQAEKNQGWELLFDGETLSKWRGLGRDTVQPDHWKVENGTIRKVNNIEVLENTNGIEIDGGDLMTIETFDNFELTFEWKIKKDGNSGIKYNVSEEISTTYGGNHSALGFEYQILDDDSEKYKGKKAVCIKKSEDAVIEIKKQIRVNGLAMKIFETRLSIDEKCLVVAFVAEGRVDFRNVVRELSNKYKKTFRFQQIGSRDEARQLGGYGICGRELCCRKFPGSLKSITTEMARCQMVSHRGTERISGGCGRLMCCLGFEFDQYEELLKKLPKKGDKIKTEGGDGIVIDLNPIMQEVKVKMKDHSIVSVKKEDLR